MNFNRRGEATTLANSLSMFFNAVVQGNSQLIRSLATDPREIGGMTLAQKGAAAMVVGGVMLTLLNHALSEVDGDEESFYEKIPDHEKERNLIIMSPINGRDYYKIPLPYGYNLFHVTGMAMTEAFLGLRTAGGAGAVMLHSFLDGFSPIGLPTSDDAGVAARGLAPTLAQLGLSPLTFLDQALDASDSGAL